MKIVCIGGGPAGLYFAISMKLRDPMHDITVIERNKPNDTFGWGVVFSDQTMENLDSNDWRSAEQIHASFAHWDDIDVHFAGQVIRSGGHGFSGIGRRQLLNILQSRAADLGVTLRFEENVDDVTGFPDADLIIAADGVNSLIRNRYEDKFQPDINWRHNRFIWLGTKKQFDAFTFIFEETEFGWMWAHAYRFDNDTSTFIVEMPGKVWEKAGFGDSSVEDSVAWCQSLFSKYLDGNDLLNDAPHLGNEAWRRFPRISCARWSFDNVVLMGDAAHTAHFSIGSGTKLAFEDAISLADLVSTKSTLQEAFDIYEQDRRLEVVKLQGAARNSTQWFEDVPRYVHQEPIQFAYSLLTRSQRVSHENLRLRDRPWLESVERWFAGRAGVTDTDQATPPMFAPFKLRDMKLVNRVVVSPMAMYSAVDGTPGDFHLVHLGSRAQGGAGLVFTEMTDVSADGRITPGCAGMYKDEHLAAWQRIVEFVHSSSQARICLQLAHAGPKGSTKLGWEGMDEPLDDGNWELIAPSALPWSSRNQTPRAMTTADMARVRDDFVRATEMADAAGFDMIELHCAHGYLLSAFITPLSNRRDDEFGGSLENRMRYPLAVARAMRAAWPAHKPMSVRISATDWAEGGITGDDAVEIARAFANMEIDIINVSAGQTTTDAAPVYGRMFQTPFSDRIRHEVGIPTLTVGNIYEADHINSILAAGRADLCAMARPHLADPYWTLHAAAEANYDGAWWPPQYLNGRDQLTRLTEKLQQQKTLI